MRVNVDGKMLADPRFKKLGQRLRVSHFEAFGRVLPVWMMAYENRSAFMSPDDVDALGELAGLADAMIACDLAVAQDGTLRLRGVEERVRWLLEQDRKRDLAAQARRAKRSPKPSPSTSPGTFPREVPREFPDQDQEQEHDHDLISGSGSTAPSELPDFGATVRAERVQPAPSGYRRPRDEQRRRLWVDSWTLAGLEHAKLKAEGIDPHAMNCWSGTPSAGSEEGKALFERIDELTLGDDPDWDAARDRIRNRVLVAAAEARAKHKHLRYFTPMALWNAKSFAIAAALSPAQVAAAANAPRAGPASSRATDRIRHIPEAGDDR